MLLKQKYATILLLFVHMHIGLPFHDTIIIIIAITIVIIILLIIITRVVSRAMSGLVIFSQQTICLLTPQANSSLKVK